MIEAFIAEQPFMMKNGFTLEDREKQNTFSFQNNTLPQKLFSNVSNVTDSMSVYERKLEHI